MAASVLPVFLTGVTSRPVLLDTGAVHPFPSWDFALAQSLADSLATISKIVSTTCEFQTPMSPPDDSKVYVYVDKTLINQVATSTDDGWMFGATSSDIVLTGSFCSNLLDGAASTVQIMFGCKDHIPLIDIP